MDDLKKMLLNIQMFAEDLDNSAANDGTDADSDVNFDDGATTPSAQVDGTVDDSDNKTKEYSKRLKADRERIRAEIEAELNTSTQSRLNEVAKGHGFDSWEELEEYNKVEKIKELGVQDPDKFEQYINEVVSKNPKIKEANEIIAKHKEDEQSQRVNEEVVIISQLDSDIKTVEDVLNHPRYDEILTRVKTGMSLVDAYKIVNFDVLTSKQTKTAEQSVYDKLNNKSHLTQSKGSSTTDIIVPTDIYNIYKKNFKNWTDAQIKEHYKKTTGGAK